jgi:hypothetical protein
MNNVWLLLLVHIIADFPLQTDYVFQLKQNKKWGVLLHGLIHFALSAIIFFPYWKNISLWLGLLSITVSHILVDKYKLKLGYSRSVMSFFLFGLDQFIHILILVFVANWFLQSARITTFLPFYRFFFFNTRLQIVLCAIFFVVFGSPFFIYYGRLAWESLKPSRGKVVVSFPSFRSRFFGYIERLFSILLVIVGGYFVLLVPGVYLVRIIFRWNSASDHRYIILDFFISIFFILTFYFLFYQN